VICVILFPDFVRTSFTMCTVG